MQTILDVPTTSTPPVSQVDAQHAANIYVLDHVDPSFAVVEGARYASKTTDQELWRFFIQCQDGPLYPIYVDSQTGEVIPLTNDEIRVVREKATIFAAKKRGAALPLNEHGYVLAEYARRQADSYLGMYVSLFYSATDGVFVPVVRPLWQFSIQVRLPRLGVLGIMGTIDVDAQTGEVIPLTNKQIKRIRERADAIVEFRTQTAAA